MNSSRPYQLDTTAHANALYRQAVENTGGTRMIDPTSRLFAQGRLARLTPPNAFTIVTSARTGLPGFIERHSADNRPNRGSKRSFVSDNGSLANDVGRGALTGRGTPTHGTASRASHRVSNPSSQGGGSTRSSEKVLDRSNIPTPQSRSTGINMTRDLAREKDGFWDRTTGALERIWDVSKKRFSGAWNPGGPLGLDAQTRIEQRRPGGYFHGPGGFVNEALSGPLIAAGDTISRTGNGLLHAGAYGANQIASELGLFSQHDRRMARDILGMAQMSFSRFGRLPVVTDGARQTVRAARKAGGNTPTGSRPPVTPNARASSTALVPLQRLDRFSRLKAKATLSKGKMPAHYSGPDFIATRNGTAVHASQEKLRRSITKAGAKFTNPTTGSHERGDIYSLNTPNGVMDIRIMQGKQGAAPNSYFGPRTVNTKYGDDKEYVYPDGGRIKGQQLKPERREIGHIHGQRHK